MLFGTNVGVSLGLRLLGFSGKRWVDPFREPLYGLPSLWENALNQVGVRDTVVFLHESSLVPELLVEELIEIGLVTLDDEEFVSPGSLFHFRDLSELNRVFDEIFIHTLTFHLRIPQNGHLFSFEVTNIRFGHTEESFPERYRA